jgi:DNA processing protein
MMRSELLFGLHELPGVGWKTIERLVAALGRQLDGLLTLTAKELADCGLRPKTAERISERLTDEFIASRLEMYKTKGISVLTRFDKAYPPLLKQISDPPWVLYYKGDIGRLRQPAVAIVGTRSPTAYGKKVAFDLAKDLSARGLLVVSGLARGIDAAAHRGGLAGAGGTAAVLGCSLDTVYPPENAALYAEIAENGVVLTEYPLGTPIHPGMFPLRNRIISGLSLGVAVVEAAEKSGALITADLALEQSRDVFAVPGPVTSPKSAGTLELIRQGAKLIMNAEHILEEYNDLPIIGHAENRPVPAFEETLAADERLVLNLLHGGPVTFDELLKFSGFDFGHLHSVLLHLILTKKIDQLPGSAYIALER